METVGVAVLVVVAVVALVLVTAGSGRSCKNPNPAPNGPPPVVRMGGYRPLTPELEARMPKMGPPAPPRPAAPSAVVRLDRDDIRFLSDLVMLVRPNQQGTRVFTKSEVEAMATRGVCLMWFVEMGPDCWVMR